MNRDEEEEAKVAKAKKFLAMVESEKARVKDYTKLVKYGIKWKSEDDIAYVILEDLWLKYGKDDKGKGKLIEDVGSLKIHSFSMRVTSLGSNALRLRLFGASLRAWNCDLRENLAIRALLPEQRSSFYVLSLPLGEQKTTLSDY
ncbi:hypothetical protein Tco_0637466 [Tanacetum coccineum]